MQNTKGNHENFLRVVMGHMGEGKEGTNILGF